MFKKRAQRIKDYFRNLKNKYIKKESEINYTIIEKNTYSEAEIEKDFKHFRQPQDSQKPTAPLIKSREEGSILELLYSKIDESKERKHDIVYQLLEKAKEKELKRKKELENYEKNKNRIEKELKQTIKKERKDVKIIEPQDLWYSTEDEIISSAMLKRL